MIEVSVDALRTWLQALEPGATTGVPGDERNCPISRCLRAQGARLATTGTGTVGWYDPDARSEQVERLSPALRWFRYLFDEHRGNFGAERVLELLDEAVMYAKGQTC